MPRPRSPFDSERSDAEIQEMEFEYGDQKQQIALDDKPSAKDHAKEFHAHLDVCAQCNDHPFALCETGRRLLQEAAVKIQGDPFA